MDFSLDPAHLELQDSIRGFARRTLGRGDRRAEDEPVFDRDLWKACGEFGIQGLPFPPEYGGSGVDTVGTMLAMEALGEECPDQGFLFSIHAHMWSVAMPVLSFGTEAQKQRYLTALCDGSLIGAHGMSEPGSGSDAFSLATRAEKRGDSYILNGTKTFVTNAPVADVFVCFANVNPARGMWGVTAFLVERDTPGFSIGKPIHKMGLTGSPMAELIFADCEIPAENLLGREGQGSAIFTHSLGWERSCILSSTVGAMARQLSDCVTYARERKQFGKPIGDFQLVASRIADMKVRLETSRLLLYRTAWLNDRDAEIAPDAAMAKLHIAESAVQSSLDAIQVLGGYGYMREFGVERDLRDAIGARLYSGTSEIQKLIIARSLGLGAR